MKSCPDIRGARAAAKRLVVEYGIDQPNLIDIESIAFDRGVVVRKAAIDGAEAWLLRKGNKGIIRVNSRIQEIGRERFAVTHELGHWELHKLLTQLQRCTTRDIHAYRGSDAEIEANTFAAELLMPSELLTSYMQHEVSIGAVQKISQDFQTTLTASAIRFVEESTDDCYVVFSCNGIITWWRRKETGSGFWITPGQPLSSESIAWDCNRTPDYPKPMAEVPPEAWFPSNREARNNQVWEQSVILGEYDVVLTLLCVV